MNKKQKIIGILVVLATVAGIGGASFALGKIAEPIVAKNLEATGTILGLEPGSLSIGTVKPAQTEEKKDEEKPAEDSQKPAETESKEQKAEEKKPTDQKPADDSGDTPASGSSDRPAEQPTPQPQPQPQPAPQPAQANLGFYPYYNMLNARERQVYNQLFNNAKNYVETTIPDAELSAAETERVIEAFYNDRPELFWLEPNFKYVHVPGQSVSEITLEFDYNLTGDYARSAFEGKVNQIVAGARTKKTIYEQEVYVHDEIVKLAYYDRSASNHQSAYSALINGRTVCSGYTRAFQYIMMRLGVPTYYVSGVVGGEGHAWNIIYIDGAYYNVDLTMNDRTSNHAYFNVTDAVILSSRRRTGMSVNLPSCTATKYRFY